jgi:hypothetical protein
LLSIKKNNLVKTISVKSGLVYEGKKFRNTTKRYIILRDYFSNITVKKSIFCEHIIGKMDQLLVRPIELYEFPSKYLAVRFTNEF